jgi:hypothetical protein
MVFSEGWLFARLLPLCSPIGLRNVMDYDGDLVWCYAYVFEGFGYALYEFGFLFVSFSGPCFHDDYWRVVSPPSLRVVD